jgi:hypothetical protein
MNQHHLPFNILTSDPLTRTTLKTIYCSRAVGEPDSDDSELYDSDGDHRPRPKLRRNAYSQEKKLLAVTYYELTNMPGRGSNDPNILTSGVIGPKGRPTLLKGMEGTKAKDLTDEEGY